jgi:hypothetical protein
MMKLKAVEKKQPHAITGATFQHEHCLKENADTK